MTDGSLTKVHVDLPNHWGTGGESFWAAELGGDRFRIENAPFYAYDLNYHDVVEAKAASPDLKPSVDNRTKDGARLRRALLLIRLQLNLDVSQRQAKRPRRG